MRGALVCCVVLASACALLTNLDDLRGGGTDGSSESNGEASGSPCGGGHILCDDFNAGTIASFWQKPTPTNANVEIANDTYVSAPSSLRVTSTGPNAFGYVLGTFPAPLPTDFVCSVSMRVENFPDKYFSFLSPVILYDTGDPNLQDYELTYLGNNPDGYLDEHTQYADAATANDSTKKLPYAVGDGTWHRVTLNVRRSSATVELDLDDAGIGATKSITPPSNPTGIAFVVGLKSGGTEDAGWVAHFDDAVCDKL
jgi:hypothetical protein